MNSENSKTNESHYNISVDYDGIDVDDIMIVINV